MKTVTVVVLMLALVLPLSLSASAGASRDESMRVACEGRMAQSSDKARRRIQRAMFYYDLSRRFGESSRATEAEKALLRRERDRRLDDLDRVCRAR